MKRTRSGAWVTWLALTAFGCRSAPSNDEHAPRHRAAPNAASSGASVPPLPVPATWLTRSKRGALWTAGPYLGAFDFETASTSVVVAIMPTESVACAAWSEDGALLAAVSNRGSVAVWQSDGQMLVLHVGDREQARCDAGALRFATAAKTVLWAPPGAQALLLGPRLVVGVTGANARLTPERGHLFVTLDSSRSALLDPESGQPRFVLNGSTERLALSGKERFAALTTADGHLHVYDLVTGDLLGTVPGRSAAFHGERLLVTEGREDSFGDTAAYDMAPFSKRWRRSGVSVYDEARAGGRSDVENAWGVGADERRRGYSVFDLQSGRTLASWRSSGYACGYQWLWRRGTLVFAEGDLLTFWSHGRGARTVHAECGVPRLDSERRAVLADNGVWDLAKRTRSVRVNAPLGGVFGFGRGGRVLHGVATFEDSGSAERAAWDAKTGKLLWHHPISENDQPVDDEVPWWRAPREGNASSLALVDERDGSLVRFFPLVYPTGQTGGVVFDDECWDGSVDSIANVVGLPPEFPNKRCPGLGEKWQAMVSGE